MKKWIGLVLCLPRTSFDELVKLMVASDLGYAKKEYDNLMRNMGLNNS